MRFGHRGEQRRREFVVRRETRGRQGEAQHQEGNREGEDAVGERLESRFVHLRRLEGVPVKAWLTRRAWLASGATAFAAGVAGRRAGAQAPDVLTIGAGLIESHAEGYYAHDLGFFAQHGLNVEVKQLRNGATIAAAVASGDLQAGCSTVLQLAQARGHNLPFVIIAAGAVHDARFAHTVGLAVAASSRIAAPKELDGKVVAASTLNGLDQLVTAALVDKNGGDSSTLKFVELSPRAMVDALEQGRIDAASLEEPELSAAGARIRSLGDGEDAIAPRFVTTAWFANEEWRAKNAAVARRFAQAIFAAGAWAMANPEKAAPILQKYLGSADLRATQRFAARNDPNELSPLARAAVQYKFAAPSGADVIRTAG